MGDSTTQALFAMLAVFLLPLVLAIGNGWHKPSSTADFLTNRGRNGYIATLAGAIAGNIGIGGFLALFLFTSQSPVIGFSIAAAYTLGLVLCAGFAATIRRVAGHEKSIGLIDLIVSTHGVRRPVWVWLPLAVVFVLRSAVQLGALGFITASVFGGPAWVSIIVCAVLICIYLLIGGYRAAVQTDILQALVIVAGTFVCVVGLGKLSGTPPAFFDLGTYKMTILIGVWLFIPWSAVLAIDNWQRITLAESTAVAQRGYLFAAALCGGIFLLMALAGYRAPSGQGMYATFLMLAPDGLGWVPAAMFVACIMSSIDTFVMPLVSGIGRKMAIGRMRLMIMGLMAATATTALAFGEALDTIIAAFSSLAVFLPVAFGALYLKNPPQASAVGSMSLGLVTAILFTAVDQNSASLVGFLVALGVYIAGMKSGLRFAGLSKTHK